MQECSLKPHLKKKKWNTEVSSNSIWAYLTNFIWQHRANNRIRYTYTLTIYIYTFMYDIHMGV